MAGVLTTRAMRSQKRPRHDEPTARQHPEPISEARRLHRTAEWTRRRLMDLAIPAWSQDEEDDVEFGSASFEGEPLIDVDFDNLAGGPAVWLGFSGDHRLGLVGYDTED